MAEAVIHQGEVGRQVEEEEEMMQPARQVEEEEEVMAARQVEEEEELQMARQPMEEEEELQMARQSVEEEEEMMQPARQVEEEEELQMARQPVEEEEELQMARQVENDDPKAKEDQWVGVMEQIATSAEGKKPRDKKEYEEAIKTTGKALLETGAGKQLTEQAKRFLLSSKGMPLTLTLGAGALAAMIANNTEVPSIPIPLSENMELTIDVKGSITNPEGVFATFTLKF